MAPWRVSALPPGVLVSGLAMVGSRDGNRLIVVETTAAGVKPARTLVTTLSIPILLATVAPDVDMAGRVLRLTDPTGKVLAEFQGPFDPSALPGEVLDIATMA